MIKQGFISDPFHQQLPLSRVHPLSPSHSLSPPPPSSPLPTRPTLFDMMANDDQTRQSKHSLEARQRVSRVLETAPFRNPGNWGGFGDVKLSVSGRDGFKVSMDVHRRVLADRSRFFAAKLRLDGGGGVSHLVEICDCDDVEVYVETVVLMYCDDLKNRLVGEEVSKVLGLLKDNCTYAVTIETTCTKGAETSDHISLRFGDTKSNEILVKHLNHKHVRWVDPLQPQVLDDVPRMPFQACHVDQFQITGQCVESPICYLYLKLTGDDDWRPGFAQVRALDGAHLSSNYFYFRRYLPRHVWHGSDFCDKEVTPFGIKYKRKVFVKKTASHEPLLP